MKPLPYDLSEITLLYVEDENDARGMVGRMLAMNYPGLTIYTAENGAVGLEMFREHRPEIVMTDINMPVMDGIRMCREIKALVPDTVTIAVTAHSDTSYLLSAIEIGIQHYVLKPINYEELFAVTDNIIEQIALRRLVRDQDRRLRESEQQLSEAQKIAHLGSWQWNPADDGMSWSEELYRILGVQADEVSASLSAFLDRVHPEDREAVQQMLRQVRESGQPVSEHFFRIVRADGTQRVVRGAMEAIAEGGGDAAVIGSSLDVTELKQAEEKVRALTDELEQRVMQRTSMLETTVRELENFSYAVSHDLRAPVARLEGFCRALIEDCGNCTNTECRTYAERAERVVRQIKRTIDAFNVLSHYAKCRLDLQEVDLSAMARSIVENLRQSQPERQVEVHIAEGLQVRGDPRLLRIVMDNLMGNAWKFTAHKPEARIEVGSIMKGGKVLFVRDNGAGFDMRYADKLFKPFQTVHSPTAYSWNGTSIGLASAHSIILRHGGRIWAEGVVEGGATFYFTIEENPESGNFLY